MENSDLARGANELGPAKGGTCHERERKRPGERHSPLEAAESGYVRTWKASDLMRGTHERGIAERGHAKCFGVEILEIIEASGEAFHCGCR